MSKKINLTVMIVFIITLTTSCQVMPSQQVPIEQIPIQGDYVQFDYNDLKKSAEIIALIEVVDDLSEENSKVTYDEYDTEQDTIIEFYSLRKVRVLETYYNEQNSKKETLEIIEPTAIIDNKYLHAEGYEKMEKGEKYIVFIGNDTASGNYSLISANNGIVDFKKMQTFEYYEIRAKAIIEFESDMPNELKEKIIGSKVLKPSGGEGGFTNNEQIITIRDSGGKEITSITIKYEYDELSNVTYIQFVD